MIFQFHTDNVTFFEEDREYFEKRFLPLKKFTGSSVNDDGAIIIDIKITKNKHSSGNRFESSVNIDCPGLGTFYSDTNANNIRKCADLLSSVLKGQIKKANEKKIGQISRNFNSKL